LLGVAVASAGGAVPQAAISREANIRNKMGNSNREFIYVILA
jgi:hypothetical protein